MYFFTDVNTALAPSLIEQADKEELASLKALLVADLDAGALGVGLALDYFSDVEFFLDEVAKAREEGVDITTEVLPYNAGSALISSAVFSRDWQTIFNITYEDVEWAATGERLLSAAGK